MNPSPSQIEDACARMDAIIRDMWISPTPKPMSAEERELACVIVDAAREYVKLLRARG